MYYTKNGLPLEDDPLTKDADLYRVAPGDSTALLHRNREPRFYACIGFDRGTFEIDGTTITLKLRGGELHGSTLKETDEYQSCTGYVCQKWISRTSYYDKSLNTYTYTRYAYPYLRLAELYLSYAEADFEYNGSLSGKSLEYINRVRRRCGLPVRRPPLPRSAPLEGGARGDEQAAAFVEPRRQDAGRLLSGDPGRSGRPRARVRIAEELLAGHSAEPDQQEPQPGAEPGLLKNRMITHIKW